jgi:hypothetical protein
MIDFTRSGVEGILVIVAPYGGSASSTALTTTSVAAIVPASPAPFTPRRMNGELDPIQLAFWEMHGLQRGFCTPGMIIAAHELLKENPDHSEDEILRGLSGNLCRCTGYVKIIESVRYAAKLMKSMKAATKRMSTLKLGGSMLAECNAAEGYGPAGEVLR